MVSRGALLSWHDSGLLSLGHDALVGAMTFLRECLTLLFGIGMLIILFMLVG
jgi:hypothetical protein